MPSTIDAIARPFVDFGGAAAAGSGAPGSCWGADRYPGSASVAPVYWGDGEPQAGQNFAPGVIVAPQRAQGIKPAASVSETGPTSMSN